MSTGTETTQAPLIKSDSLDFITSIPLVAGVCNYADSILKAHPLLDRTYQLGHSMTASALQLAQPLTSLVHKPLAIADSWVLSALNFTKSKCPYPFEVKWEELRSQKPVEQLQQTVNKYTSQGMDTIGSQVKGTAQYIYDTTDKVLGQAQQHESAYVKRAGETLSSMQQKVNQLSNEYAERAKTAQNEGEKKAQGLYNSMLADLDGLQKQVKSLPAEGQKRLEPFMNLFGKAYEEISAEATKSNVPMQERLSNSAHFLQDNMLPELQKLVSDNLRSAGVSK